MVLRAPKADEQRRVNPPAEFLVASHYLVEVGAAKAGYYGIASAGGVKAMLRARIQAQDLIREMEVIDDPSSVTQNRVGSDNARSDYVKEIGLVALFEDLLALGHSSRHAAQPQANCLLRWRHAARRRLLRIARVEQIGKVSIYNAQMNAFRRLPASRRPAGPSPVEPAR
jgi:hypothetical protein